MNRAEFYKVYIPALKKALANDEVNLGYYVLGPEDYIKDENIASEVSDFIDKDEENAHYYELIEYYFDAKSHNFPNLNGESLNKVKSKILNFIKSLPKFDVSDK